MERNREKIDENGKINNYITVLNAYLNGKEIEYRLKYRPKESNEAWQLAVKPVFDFYHIEYRIKPKQIYRPYINGNEAFTEIFERTPSGWLYNTVTMLYEQVLCIGDNGIYTRDNDYSYQQAFETLIYPNNEKFGVKLNNNSNEKD